jgi:hypothetical protein
MILLRGLGGPAASTVLPISPAYCHPERAGGHDLAGPRPSGFEGIGARLALVFSFAAGSLFMDGLLNALPMACRVLARPGRAPPRRPSGALPPAAAAFILASS